MNRIINTTKQLIFAKQKGIFASSLILSAMIIISRIFGFLRYRILAGYFTKEELDLFFASFRIPDLVFEILITGALTSTLIPIFIKYQKNQKQLEQNISAIFNILTAVLFIAVIILFFSMPWIIPIITPGFSVEKVRIVVFYSQLLLIGQLPFLIIGNFLTGIAQANKTFVIAALAPVVYNLAIIFSTIFFVDRFHLFAPVVGVVVGALLFFLVQIPIVFNVKFHFLLFFKVTDGVREFFRLVVPRVMTVLVTQIDATVDLMLATYLGAGSYTIFYLAQHLQLLPVSVFGIAYGQASLPYLSELYQDKKIEELKKVIASSIIGLFFIAIPIMGFFIFARTPLVRLFFGGDKFDWPATVQTATTLSYFALSLPLHSIYYFLVRSFYALLDTRTPFYTSLFSITINALLSIYFVLYLKLPVWSLAISFSVAISINTILLGLILSRRIGGLPRRMLFSETIKIAGATFVASFFSYYLSKLLDGLILDTSRTFNVLLLLFITGGVYVLLYLFLSWLFNVREMYMITRLATQAREYRRKIVELYTTYE